MIINPLTQKSISQVIINFKEQSLFCLLVSDFLDPTQNSKLCNLTVLCIYAKHQIDFISYNNVRSFLGMFSRFSNKCSEMIRSLIALVHWPQRSIQNITGWEMQPSSLIS